MKGKIFVSGFMLQLLFLACQKESISIAANIDCTTVTYANVIQPLLQQNCSGASCHGTNGSRGDLMTYSKLKPYVNNGSFRREVLDRQSMPEGGSLSSQELGQIKCWLDNGALND